MDYSARRLDATSWLSRIDERPPILSCSAGKLCRPSVADHAFGICASGYVGYKSID
jgi:hypothetical protein